MKGRPMPSKSSPGRSPRVTKDPADYEVGSGGETHQRRGRGEPLLTTAQGTPISDDQNSLKVGERGPTLMNDFVMRDKIFHFDHERIPERVVHARGYGAHGFFETYEPLSDLTRADLFQRRGQRTPVFVRFSTVAGNKGSADLARDVRGFAVKFYTQQGNWDLVGNNIPVFFVQDAMKFPDLVHAVKDEPDRGFPQAASAHDNFWDFASLMPETTHMLMWVMSDRAIPRSFRFMEGFGVHTFRFVNAAGESSFVKFHWKPKLGMQSVVWNEARQAQRRRPDFHRRDLWNSIQSGAFPEWELGVQVFDEAFADEFPFDVLDADEADPRRDRSDSQDRATRAGSGRRQLLRRDRTGCVLHQQHRPRNRLHQRSAVAGTQLLLPRHPAEAAGWAQLHAPAVNAPKCPFASFQQDGHMAMINPVGRVNYEPNSWTGDERGPREDPATGYRILRRSRRRRDAPGPRRAVRRPLQPGPPVLRQPDSGGADAHRQLVRLRAVEGRAARTSGVGWSPTCATSTKILPQQWPMDSGSPRCRQHRLRHVQPITDLAASPALSILGTQPAGDLRRSQARHPGDRRHRRKAAGRADRGRRGGGCRRRARSHRRSVASSPATRSLYPARSEDRRRTVRAVRRCRGHPLRTRRGAAGVERSGEGLRQRCSCALQVRRLLAERFGLFDAAGLTDLIDDGYVRLDAKKTTATSFVKTCRTLRHWPRESTVKTV